MGKVGSWRVVLAEVWGELCWMWQDRERESVCVEAVTQDRAWLVQGCEKSV